ncbi:hypothetical protein [Arthrobacter sp. NicSoilC12]|uniref:hypothetical protein n=1 Tax=Arthrobacter sp. NicSoilC12 TaxID=2831001 RepID=UPI001CC6443C|nr:hypothetical protein [Arthrobacter sp. NicSoilC12]GIU57478.1 hypothetical protein NicSoilC12_32270 [Arthrobacter sp. NicSoilC12]
MRISFPSALGAVVLKGAAYRDDSRDKDRRLGDAMVLCATIKEPLDVAAPMRGRGKSRVLTLHNEAGDPKPLAAISRGPTLRQI